MENKDNNDMDIKFLISFYWSQKNLIAFLVALACSVTAIYSLSVQEIYTSETTLEPRESNSAQKNPLLDIGASFSGINLFSSNVDELKRNIAILKSKDFFQRFYDSDYLPLLMAVKQYDKTSNQFTYDETYDSETKTWNVSSGVSMKPNFENAHNVFLSSIDIGLDNNSGLLSLSFSHLSPEFSKDFLETLVLEVNSYVSQSDSKEIDKSIEFLTLRISEVNISEIRTALLDILKSQLEKKMLHEINTDYAFKYVDKPREPIYRSYPKRTVLVALSGIISFIFSIIFIMVLNLMDLRLRFGKPTFLILEKIKVKENL